jgi:hypothetical protein
VYYDVYIWLLSISYGYDCVLYFFMIVHLTLVSYLCGYALNDTTMLIMVIYAIMILIRMTSFMRAEFSLMCAYIDLIFVHSVSILSF